jgi:hypothetical protein
MEKGRDMRRRSARRLEEILRSSASRERREPPADLRSKVLAAIRAGGSEIDRDSVAGPLRRTATSEPRRVAFVAAAMMLSIGLGVFAFFQSVGGSAHPPGVSDRTALIGTGSAGIRGTSAIGSPASPRAFERLALACPRTLRTAVDDPLLAELEDIAEDATRAVRFLAGRVPTSLVARTTDDSGR